MARYLFVTWEGGGNVPPVLGLASDLIRNGHTVTVLGEPCLESAICGIGAEYVPLQKHFTRTDRAIDLIQDWKAKPLTIPSIENILVRPATDVARETEALIKQLRPDVLVADFMMIGALIAAEAHGVKRVALFHMPEYLPGPGRPPGGMGLLPMSGKIGRIRDAVLAKTFHLVLRQYLPRLNQTRAAFSLAPYKTIVDVFHEADLRLIQTCEAFDAPIRPAPENVRYVGPVLDDPAWTDSDATQSFRVPGKKLVVVSLSSTFQNQKTVLDRIIAALAKVDAHCIVTLGPAMADESFDSPPNVELFGSLPHSAIFPEADAVITHAGHGTVMRALSHGLPLICLPFGRDQLDNATLVQHHGAGLKLNKNVRYNKLVTAINEVLSEPGFKKSAMQLKAKIQQDVADNRASEILEALAQTG